MTAQLVLPELKTFPLDDRVAVCQRLADVARDGFEGPAPTGGRDRPGERMVLAVWGRAAGTFTAALLLAENSYGDQVGMLARALFESGRRGHLPRGP